MAAVPHDQSAKVSVGRTRISPRKAAKWLIIFLILAVITFFGYRYWNQSRLYVSTEDAYVNTDRTEIAAQVSGRVEKLYVIENQPVKGGDTLFDLDARPYEVALDRANAQLRLAEQSVSQQDAAVA